jgi:hypothetical protein
MITVDIASGDVRRVLKNLNRFSEKVKEGIAYEVVKHSSNIATNAQRRCPYNHGILRASIRVKYPTGKTGPYANAKGPRLIGVVDKMTALVGTGIKYAAPVEFGSRPHIIRAKNVKYLHFKIKGKSIFTKVVHHPGTRPQPFLEPAARMEVQPFIQGLIRVIKAA